MRAAAVTLLATLVIATSLAGCGSDDRGDGAGGGSASGGATGPGPGVGAGGPGACSTSELRTGEATYYDFADGSGNCGFDATPEDLRVAAMNHTDYSGSAACGACARVVGPNGEITVRIVDQCPECPAGDIDLSPEAFSQIAPLEAGRVAIEWEYVPCAVEGPVVYHFKEGSNQWWTAVQIRNHRYAIADVAYQAAGGSFVSVAREDYNYFVEASGMGPGPYTFRITDDNGQTLEDTGIQHVEAGDVPGAAQFGDCE